MRLISSLALLLLVVTGPHSLALASEPVGESDAAETAAASAEASDSGNDAGDESGTAVEPSSGDSAPEGSGPAAENKEGGDETPVFSEDTTTESVSEANPAPHNGVTVIDDGDTRVIEIACDDLVGDHTETFNDIESLTVSWSSSCDTPEATPSEGITISDQDDRTASVALGTELAFTAFAGSLTIVFEADNTENASGGESESDTSPELPPSESDSTSTESPDTVPVGETGADSDVSEEPSAEERHHLSDSPANGVTITDDGLDRALYVNCDEIVGTHEYVVTTDEVRTLTLAWHPSCATRTVTPEDGLTNDGSGSVLWEVSPGSTVDFRNESNSNAQVVVVFSQTSPTPISALLRDFSLFSDLQLRSTSQAVIEGYEGVAWLEFYDNFPGWGLELDILCDEIIDGQVVRIDPSAAEDETLRLYVWDGNCRVETVSGTVTPITSEQQWRLSKNSEVRIGVPNGSTFSTIIFGELDDVSGVLDPTLTLSKTQITGVVGQPVDPIEVSVANIENPEFTFAPALPKGIVFEGGSIGGIPQETADGSYTVSVGGVSENFTIKIDAENKGVEVFKLDDGFKEIGLRATCKDGESFPAGFTEYRVSPSDPASWFEQLPWGLRTLEDLVNALPSDSFSGWKLNINHQDNNGCQDVVIGSLVDGQPNPVSGTDYGFSFGGTRNLMLGIDMWAQIRSADGRSWIRIVFSDKDIPELLSPYTQTISGQAEVPIDEQVFFPAQFVDQNLSFTLNNEACLPSGLSLDSQTGYISGEPANAGDTSCQVTATFGGITATTLVYFDIDAAPVPVPSLELSASTVSAKVGEQIVPLTANPINFSPTGFTLSPSTIPEGMAFDSNTGTLSGRPTMPSAMTTFTISAQHADGTSLSESFNLSVSGIGPWDSTLIIERGAEVKRGDFTISASGFTDPSIATIVNPPLPASLTLEPLDVSMPASLMGQVLEVGDTTHEITATATNLTATATLRIRVTGTAPFLQQPRVVSGGYVETLPLTVVLPTYTGPVSFSASNLLLGLSIDSETGVISGTPTQVVDAHQIVITASGGGEEVTSQVALTVTAPPGLTLSRDLLVLEAGEPLTVSSFVAFQVRWIDAPINSEDAPTFSIEPSLPSGLILGNWWPVGYNDCDLGSPVSPFTWGTTLVCGTPESSAPGMPPLSTHTVTATAWPGLDKEEKYEATLVVSFGTPQATFTFDTGVPGVASPGPRTEEVGVSFLLPALSRSGFDFDGWYTAQDDFVGMGGADFEVTLEVILSSGGTLPLFAKWTEVAEPVEEAPAPPSVDEPPTQPVVSPPTQPGGSGNQPGSRPGGQRGTTVVVPIIPVAPNPVAPAPAFPRESAPPVTPAPPAQLTPAPAPAAPAPAIPPRTADTGSVLQRNLEQPSGTVDLGGGVQSLGGANQGSPGTLLRTGEVPVRTPGEKRAEVLQGFAPGSTTEIEVVGARTGARFVLSAQVVADKERAAEAIARSAGSSSTDFFEVRRVQAVSAPEPKPSWSESERNAVSSLFESSGLLTPKSLNDFDVSGFTEWVKIESEAKTYVPGSTVYLTVTSEPIVIGQARVNASGDAELVGTIPMELLGTGEHRIRLIGIRLLDGVNVDADGNVQVSDATMAEIQRFDQGTQVTVAVLGQNPEGEQHTSLRIVALPEDLRAAWWPLWFIAGTFGLFVVARTRGLLGQPTRRRIGLGVVGASALPAIVVGVVSGVMALTWWGLAAGLLALGLAFFVPHRDPEADTA